MLPVHSFSWQLELATNDEKKRVSSVALALWSAKKQRQVILSGWNFFFFLREIIQMSF